jgi:hypothetical protein
MSANLSHGSVCPDIAMAVHQCACSSATPMRSHEQAVMHIGQYLLSSKDKGMIYTPDPKLGLEVWMDADFAGGWNPEEADNADSVYSVLASLHIMLAALCIGKVNCKQILRYQLQKPSIF